LVYYRGNLFCNNWYLVVYSRFLDKMSWHKKNPLRDSLVRVRGLGSAHEGVGHWWTQRVSAVALIFLSVWFVYFLNLLPLSADADTLQIKVFFFITISMDCIFVKFFCRYFFISRVFRSADYS